MTIQASLSSLLRTAGSGQGRVRESAVRELWIFVQRTANRRIYSAIDPDDLNILTTDVTMDLLECGEPDRPDPQVRAFVYRLIDRRLWHARRDRWRRFATSLEGEPCVHEPFLSLLSELETLFERALEPNASQVLQLRCAGFSHREIAIITCQTPEAVRTCSSRALVRIQAWVQLDLQDGIARLAEIIGHDHARLMRMLLLEGRSRQDIADTTEMSHAQVNAKIQSAWRRLVGRIRSQPTLE